MNTTGLTRITKISVYRGKSNLVSSKGWEVQLLNSGIDDLNLTLRAMNKLLFSIPLLCFSVAASAELWF